MAAARPTGVHLLAGSAIGSSSASTSDRHTHRVDRADTIWNRALRPDFTATLAGDRALAAVLRFHSQTMFGGLVDAVETLDGEALNAAEAGYRWLHLAPVAAVVADVRKQVESGPLDDERAEALELAADDRYDRLVPSDVTIEHAFRSIFHDQPETFA